MELDKKEEFRNWLINNGYSYKVSSNIISRCIRVGVNIEHFNTKSIVDSEFYNEIYIEIGYYSRHLSQNIKRKEHILSGTLRYALKLYREFSIEY